MEGAPWEGYRLESQWALWEEIWISCRRSGLRHTAGLATDCPRNSAWQRSHQKPCPRPVDVHIQATCPQERWSQGKTKRGNNTGKERNKKPQDMKGASAERPTHDNARTLPQHSWLLSRTNQSHAGGGGRGQRNSAAARAKGSECWVGKEQDGKGTVTRRQCGCWDEQTDREPEI